MHALLNDNPFADPVVASLINELNKRPPDELKQLPVVVQAFLDGCELVTFVAGKFTPFIATGRIDQQPTQHRITIDAPADGHHFCPKALQDILVTARQNPEFAYLIQSEYVRNPAADRQSLGLDHLRPVLPAFTCMMTEPVHVLMAREHQGTAAADDGLIAFESTVLPLAARLVAGVVHHVTMLVINVGHAIVMSSAPEDTTSSQLMDLQSVVQARSARVNKNKIHAMTMMCIRLRRSTSKHSTSQHVTYYYIVESLSLFIVAL